MRNQHTAFIILVLLAGCGNENLEKMSAEPAPPWEALQTFAGEPLRSVAYPKEMKNWGAVKAALSSPQFAEAITAFEMSPLPDAYSDRQAQKDAVVKAWRDAIAAAKSGSQEELSTKVDAAIASITAAGA